MPLARHLSACSLHVSASVAVCPNKIPSKRVFHWSSLAKFPGILYYISKQNQQKSCPGVGVVSQFLSATRQQRLLQYLVCACPNFFLSKKQSRIMSLLWGRCSRDGIFDWSLMTPCDVFEKFLFFWATVHAGKIFICIPHSTSLFLFHIRSSSSEPRLRCKRCINFTNSQPRTSGNQIINICRAQATTQEFG